MVPRELNVEDISQEDIPLPEATQTPDESGEISRFRRLLGEPAVTLAIVGAVAFSKLVNPGASAEASPVKTAETSLSAKGAGELALKKVPDIAGDTIKEAREEITHAGFKYGGIISFKHKKGVQYEASGVRQIKSFKRALVNGHKVRKPVFTALKRPGTRADNKKPFFISMRPHKENPPEPNNNPLNPVPENNTPVEPPIYIPETPPAMLTAEQLKERRVEYMKKNTVRLPFAENCTGFILRDENGKPVGVLSANHCGTINAPANYVNGSMAVNLASQDGTLNVYGGENHDQVIGQVRSVWLPPTRTDTAIYTMGDDPNLAKLAFNKMMITDQELDEHLKPGDTSAVLAGFPITQPLNNSGVVKMETFTSMVYFGTAPIKSALSLNENDPPIPMRIFGSKDRNPDGSIASAGASGSTAVVSWQNTDRSITYKILGVQSGWDDFESDDGKNTIRDPQSGNPAIKSSYIPIIQASFYMNTFNSLITPEDAIKYKAHGWTADFTFDHADNSSLFKIVLSNPT